MPQGADDAVTPQSRAEGINLIETYWKPLVWQWHARCYYRRNRFFMSLHKSANHTLIKHKKHRCCFNSHFQHKASQYITNSIKTLYTGHRRQPNNKDKSQINRTTMWNANNRTRRALTPKCVIIFVDFLQWWYAMNSTAHSQCFWFTVTIAGDIPNCF